MAPNPTYQELEARIEELEKENTALKSGKIDSPAGYPNHQSLLEDAGATFFRLDAQGVIEHISQYIFNISGYEAHEIIGHSFIEYIHEQDRVLPRKAFQDMVKVRLKPDEYRVKSKDGRLVWVRSFSRPIYDGDNFVGLSGILLDVDQRRRDEEELRRQKQRLESLIQHAALAIVTLDERQRILSCNSYFEDTFGFTESEIVGRVLDEVVTGDEPEGTPNGLMQKVLGGRTIYDTGRRRRQDGSSLHVEIFGVPVVLDGQVVGAYAIYRDVTDLLRVQEALQENEQRYRTILESSGDGYYEVDLSGRFTFCSESFCRILGYSREEIIGRSFRDVGTPESIQQALVDFGVVNKTGQAIKGREWVIKTKKGTLLQSEVSAFPILGEGGGVKGFRGLTRDISHRKETEAALQASEEEYRALYDNALVPMFRVTLKEGTILKANEVALELFRCTADEFNQGIANAFDYYLDPRARGQVLEALKTTGRVDAAVAEMKRLDGSTFWAEFTLQAHPDDGCVDGIILDISGRHQAQAALKQSEESYRLLFDSIDDLIMTHDLDGNFLDLNPAVCRVTGYSREELLGKCLGDLIVNKYRSIFFNYYLPQIRKREHLEGIFVILAKDGREHYVEYSNRLVVPGDGASYVTSVSRDVSERMQAQRELRSMEEQLAQSQKMQAVGTLASGIAHDFNNILQAITGYIQLMLRQKDRDQTDRKYLSEVNESVERASELVRGLLTFGRSVKTELKPVDLNQEVVNTVKLLERTIPKMIGIETSLARNLQTIHGDSGQLQQILMNLGANAKDAMPAGGNLTITTRNVRLDESFCVHLVDLKPGEYVLLQVADNGVGMEEKVSRHIFEPFFTTKEVGQGTGLGLSTVYGIVRGHGGHIKCETSTEQGTTFNIYFPALPAGATVKPEEKDEDEQVCGGRETILLVDDEKSILEVGKDLLGAYGYTTIGVASGEEALAVFQDRHHQIDLVILDLGMPGMGGENCLKELLALDPEVRVIIASGYTINEGLKSVVKAGAMDFLPKPYRLVDLLKKVRDALDRKPA